MSFLTIRGQSAVKRVLQQALRSDKLSHAYIFSGPVGTGREQMAVTLAEAVFCLELKDDACGYCLECRKVQHGNHPDLYRIEPDGASIKIDQIRQLQKQFSYRASGSASGTRIYIIQDADKMTMQAANSLLKFLEEPASRILAILITENGQALLPTIQSRAQWLSFTPMARQEMADLLQEEGFSLPLILPAVHLTAGPEAAKALITANWFAEIRNVVIQLTQEAMTRFPTSLITLQQKWTKAELSDHVPTFFAMLLLWLKDMAQLGSGIQGRFVYIDQLDWMRSLSFGRSESEWVRLMEKAVELQKRLRFNANAQLLVESMLMELQGV
jgi:DNA polymerase III subunit delta'